MKTYGIGHASIDAYIWDVRMSLVKHGYTVDESSIIAAPLTWYVSTGRASTAFLHALVKVRPFMVARRLDHTGTYDEILSRVHALVGM